MAKFKKGDKVYFARSIYPTRFDPPLNTHGIVDENDSQAPYVLFELRDGTKIKTAMTESELELVPSIPAYSIHITADGPITHAVYKEGNKIVRRAKAVCNPEDTYHFEVGAFIALGRALGGTVTAETVEVRTVAPEQKAPEPAPAQPEPDKPAPKPTCPHCQQEFREGGK